MKKYLLVKDNVMWYSQLSISSEHVWVSRGKWLRSMLHMAVTVTLEKTHIDNNIRSVIFFLCPQLFTSQEKEFQF